VSRGSDPGFVRRVLRLAVPYWHAEHRWRVRGAVVALLALTVAQVGLAVWINHWNRDLFDALERRALREVLAQAAVFVAILVSSIVVTGVHLMVKRWLQLDWRRWLASVLLGHWMADGRHHRLALRPGEHDNPDARIAEDVRIATETAVALAHGATYALLSFLVFVPILWDVSGTIRVPGIDVLVPGYLVLLAFLYSAAGVLLGWRFGRPLVRATDALQGAEADYRFGLARMRDRSESIAMLRGEPAEREGAARRFVRIVREWNRQSIAYAGLVGFTTGYGALLPVFPLLVAAPQYVLGTVSLGMLMQGAQAFQRLALALSWPTDNLGEIARTRASVERVLALHDALRRLDADASAVPRH
jgi:putative ATP-binding cassette transporter